MLSLSLDGGGVRGAMQTGIVAQLNDATSFLNHVTMFTGTSIGSFVAAALAFGENPHDLLKSFEENGDKIFERGTLNKVLNPIGWAKCRYDNKNLRELVFSFFGNKTFGDLNNKLLVPTFGLNVTHPLGQHARPKIYSNIGTKATLDKSVTEAVMESMAAPTFFPTVNNCIDGGVFANNPSICLLAELMRDESVPNDKIWMLSIGSGTNPIRLDLGDVSWGLTNWVLKGHLLPILMGEATTGSNHYYTETILGSRYCRIQPHFKEMVEMDQCEEIPFLIKTGCECAVDEAHQFLHDYKKAMTGNVS